MPREFEISTTIDGSPDEAWAVLTDLEDYSKWSRLLPFAKGAVVPGGCPVATPCAAAYALTVPPLFRLLCLRRLFG